MRKMNKYVEYIDDRNYGGLKVPDPKTFFDEFEKENN